MDIGDGWRCADATHCWVLGYLTISEVSMSMVASRYPCTNRFYQIQTLSQYFLEKASNVLWRSARKWCRVLCALAMVFGCSLPACRTHPGKMHVGLVSLYSGHQTAVIRGMASWYGPRFHGKKTASGEVFNQEAMTCAHRTLPFGTRVYVQDPASQRGVMLVVNDQCHKRRPLPSGGG